MESVLLGPATDVRACTDSRLDHRVLAGLHAVWSSARGRCHLEQPSEMHLHPDRLLPETGQPRPSDAGNHRPTRLPPPRRADPRIPLRPLARRRRQGEDPRPPHRSRLPQDRRPELPPKRCQRRRGHEGLRPQDTEHLREVQHREGGRPPRSRRVRERNGASWDTPNKKDDARARDEGKK
jgi:hypothetical protein